MASCNGRFHLLVCLFVCRQIAKTQFSQKLSNLEPWCLLATYRSRTWPFQRTQYWTWLRSATLKIDMTSFFCWGWSDLDKILLTGAEWHVDCGDMVKIETRCRIAIWRTFAQIPWHVIPEPRFTLRGAATWWIHCHDSRATCRIAGCSHLAGEINVMIVPHCRM